MTEVHMIPDTPDKEVDWTVDPRRRPRVGCC
jgi:hypothetical protein